MKDKQAVSLSTEILYCITVKEIPGGENIFFLCCKVDLQIQNFLAHDDLATCSCDVHSCYVYL